MSEPTTLGIIVLGLITLIGVAAMLKMLQTIPLDSKTRSNPPELYTVKRKHRKACKVRPAVARQFEGW